MRQVKQTDPDFSPDRVEPRRHLKTRKALPVLLLYAAFCLFTAVMLFIRVAGGQWKEACLCAVALGCFALPALIEKICRVRLPAPLEIIAQIFIFATLVLGELFKLYIRIPFWDNLMHFISGFMFAAFGYCLVDVFSRKGNARRMVSPAFLTFVAVCFSIAVSVCWEFFEFAVDNICHMDMQKDTLLRGFSTFFSQNAATTPLTQYGDIAKTTVEMADGQLFVVAEGGYLDIGLVDTMSDMLIQFLGTAVFAVIGILDAKSHGKGRVGSLFIPVLCEETGKGEQEEAGKGEQGGEKEKEPVPAGTAADRSDPARQDR